MLQIKISQVESDVATGAVEIIHWRATLSDSDATVSNYGTLDVTGRGFCCETVTEDCCIKAVREYLEDHGFEERLVEALELKKNPPKAKGLPWVNRNTTE